MERAIERKLVLEDGQIYGGFEFGAASDRVCELVFNTSMAGYQEIMSDPSYTDQAVVFTYPLIGNYGMAADDYETDTPTVGALVVREYNDSPSNFRSLSALDEVMRRYGIPGICGVDTRRLTRSIRDYGTRRALLTDASTPLADALRVLQSTPTPHDAVSRVSCRERRTQEPAGTRFHVVAVDCGMKKNIVRALLARGCRVTIVPWNTPARDIEACRPDGVLLSNGPGDPTDVPEVIETVRALRGRYPLFGICLGHQILSLAYGARTYKLKFGHRGGNHPVRSLQTGRIEITSQNHSYAVDADSLAGTALAPTHINLLDGTIEGVACAQERVFGVQYHPESAPGPQDSGYLFDRFIRLMEEGKDNA